MTPIRRRDAWFRIACGCLTAGLSLVCVISCLPYLVTMPGSDRLSVWGFFLWGLGLAAGGLWLIRGRSKGKAVVFVRQRRRLVVVGVLAVAVVGLLVYYLNLPAVGEDALWKPLGLRTMFANLFASVPFLLFDREDYREKDPPAPLGQAGRRKGKRIIISLAAGGVLFLPAGVFLGEFVHPWWDILSRLGAAFLAGAALLGYKLKKAPSAVEDRDRL